MDNLVERFIEKDGAYDEPQFADGNEPSVHDTLLLLMLCWLLLIKHGFLVGAHCVDVSGTFAVVRDANDEKASRDASTC